MNNQVLGCQVNLLGNVVSKQNTVRYFADGKAVLMLDLVVKKSWKTAQGELKSHDTFVTVRVLDSLAEQIAKQVQAGDALFVQGRLGKYIEVAQLQWADKNKLFWNQVYCSGVVSQIERLKSVSDADYLKLVLQLEQTTLEVNLRGKTAELMLDKLTEQQSLLVEGALGSKSVKTASGYERQYWIDGHTCVNFEVK
ncbi:MULTISPECIES: single-stranded DNA-binding protein [unclassified Motilimonas]|uniref:single-stranded DNA-binding protein n=1 Tax=unclassified Motilimonas TaxID=2643697 RepID=UPI001E516E60|nr:MULTISPECIES: single-stranded DNA-binding protein [unclassified Motilimonas]MCE0558452.1 single-stranded DNA-binding protein [Motilimonas sp. E26]MDO6526576.1 single-stranded DNA-binding protein [Motilimonas sp. 1_MG-2023]